MFTKNLFFHTNLCDFELIIGILDSLCLCSDDFVASVFWGFGLPPKNHVFSYAYWGALQSFTILFLFEQMGLFLFLP